MDHVKVYKTNETCSQGECVERNGSDNIFFGNLSNEQILDQIKDFIRPSVHHWIFMSLFLVVFLVGTTGNVLVCYSVWRSRSLKTVTNYFLVNLSVADFLVILICLPSSIVSDVLQSWFFGIIMCKISVYLQRVSVFVSVLTLTSISVERYLAICHPLRHYGAYFKTRLIIVAIWMIALIVPSPDFYNMVLVHDEQIPESLRPWLTVCAPRDPEMEMQFNFFLIAAFYLAPVLVMSFTYIMIAICLWSSTSQTNTGAEILHNESAIEQLKTRRRTAKMLIVVVITFALCFLPIYVLNIARYTNALDPIKANRAAIVCVFWTARFLNYFNSAINPVIYNFMSVKFRKQFKTACFGCYVHLRFCCFFFRRKRPLRRRPTHLPMTMNKSTYSTGRMHGYPMTFVNESKVSEMKSSST